MLTAIVLAALLVNSEIDSRALARSSPLSGAEEPVLVEAPRATTTKPKDRFIEAMRSLWNPTRKSGLTPTAVV